MLNTLITSKTRLKLLLKFFKVILAIKSVYPFTAPAVNPLTI